MSLVGCMLSSERTRSALAAMAKREAPAGIPCHRVVNAKGQIAPGWPEQRSELEREGVTFNSNGCVDLTKHLW